MTAADTARKAAEIMSERGHCKGIEEDGEGRVCFVGAVNLAQLGVAMRPSDVTDYPDIEAILRAAAGILVRRGEYLADNLVSMRWPMNLAIFWNNRRYVTGEDVIMLLKETAEELESAL